MNTASFPTQAQIIRAIQAAQKAGLRISGFRIEPGGGVVVFSADAFPVALNLPPGEGEKNAFD